MDEAKLNPIHRLELIILCPVYDDWDSLKQLVAEISRAVSGSVLIIIVNDGSIAPTPESLTEESKTSGPGIEVISLAHNVGHQEAIAIGIRTVVEQYSEAAPYLIVMDSDGEDSPASIKTLVTELQNNPKLSIVTAARRRRHATFEFKVFYTLYRFIFKLLTGRNINFGNFVGIRISALSRVASMPELSVHFAATLIKSKLMLTSVDIDRGRRYHGCSKMNYSSLILHGLRAIIVFSEIVFVRVGVACVSAALLCLLMICLAVILKIFGFATQGWFSIAVGIISIAFLQAATLAINILFLTSLVQNNRVHQSRVAHPVVMSNRIGN